MKKATALFLRIIAISLILAMTFPLTAYATDDGGIMPMASYYLDAYSSHICVVGNGKIQIWFEALGTGDMDEIGTLRIMVYESSDNATWTWKKTYLHDDYSSMLATNDFYHSSYVTYNGTAGKYYKAYVCIWAGKNGTGDTRYIWTVPQRAT